MKAKPEKVKHFNYEMIKNILSVQHNSGFFSKQEELEKRKREEYYSTQLYDRYKKERQHKIIFKLKYLMKMIQIKYITFII